MNEINVSEKWKSHIPTNENIYVSPILSENKFVPMEVKYPIEQQIEQDKFKYIQIKNWLYELNDSPELKRQLDLAWTAEEIEPIAVEIVKSQNRVGVDCLVQLMNKWFINS